MSIKTDKNLIRQIDESIAKERSAKVLRISVGGGDFAYLNEERIALLEAERGHAQARIGDALRYRQNRRRAVLTSA